MQEKKCANWKKNHTAAVKRQTKQHGEGVNKGPTDQMTWI